jgi:phosphate binding protein
MGPLRWLCCALACYALLGAEAKAQGTTRIHVKGSDAIGAALGPALARAFEEQSGAARVEWESLGSGSAFLGLLDGSAELGASSRPAEPAELELARRLGVRLHEYVIGFDAVAVIVNPKSPLQELGREQLSALFSGSTRNWKELGGPNLEVQTVQLPSYSGAQALWNQWLSGGGTPTSYAPQARFFEDGADVIAEVARSPRAIGYVSLAQIGERKVHTLALAEPGKPGVAPSAQTIRDGSYPLHRALYLYTRGEPRGAVRELLEFVLSPDGQQQIARHGFVPRDLPASLSAAQPAEPAADPAPLEVPRRIVFKTGSTNLSSSDRDLLDALLPGLLDGTRTLLIRGHADGMEPDPKNVRYSRERAEAIADYLRTRGVADDRLEVSGLGESEPVASNESSDGRRANRRVDLHLIPSARTEETGAGAEQRTAEP